MEYRLMAVDMDNTLLNRDRTISQGNEQAIRRALAAGKQVVLSTGRAIGEMRDYVQLLPLFHYAICSNGACIYDLWEKKPLYTLPMVWEETERILRETREQDVMVQTILQNQSYVDQPDSSTMEYYHMGNFRAVYDRCARWFPGLVEAVLRYHTPVEKLNLYYRELADREAMWEKLRRRHLAVTDSSVNQIIEIGHENATKGKCLARFCRMMDIPLEAAIGIGDSLNDLTMLQTAGLSVAMENGCAEAKAAADVIAPDCDRDGVAAIIEQYLLGSRPVCQ